MPKDELTCPLCGETDFDRPGFINHLDQWCDEAAKAREEWNEEMRRELNAHVLRMQALQMNAEDREEQEREEMRLDQREDD